ncbi:hypothetical protein [Amycolatopsis sp. WGS_07]|uniref:hypothetical protein n=1 Tax=Amycolatopsis sp. WGS_07 TaxID=3076764 RepID=UPI0038732A30
MTSTFSAYLTRAVWPCATRAAHRLGSRLIHDPAEQTYQRRGPSYPDVLTFLHESDDGREPWFDLADHEIATSADDVCQQLAARPHDR